MVSTAADLGYNGIEIRGVADEIYAPKAPAFLPEGLIKTKETMERTGLIFPILTSGAYLSACPDEAAAEFEVKDYIMLAAKVGAKYVRVLGEKSPEPEGMPDRAAVLEEYKKLCDFAARFGVELLIETNGALADSAVMAAFIEKADRPNMGVIWDIHHTYRFFGEAPSDTVKKIGKYIKHVHIKDSVKGRNGKITYMLTGYGDVPVEEAVKALGEVGYGGFFSYEWVKRWARELTEPGIAFYQYVDFMLRIK